MLWKVYFVILVIICPLQILGFIQSRLTFPDAPLDLLSAFFNIGILIIGPVITFLYSFQKRLFTQRMWLYSFWFVLVGNLYAIYFLIFPFASQNPNIGIPWFLVLLQLIYVPLLIANHRYQNEFCS